MGIKQSSPVSDVSISLKHNKFSISDSEGKFSVDSKGVRLVSKVDNETYFHLREGVTQYAGNLAREIESGQHRIFINNSAMVPCSVLQRYKYPEIQDLLQKFCHEKDQ